MKFCQQCGAELPANAGFCPKCGSRVEPGIQEEPVQETMETGQAEWPDAQVTEPPAPAPGAAGETFSHGAPVYPAPPPPYPYGAPAQPPPQGYYGGPQPPYPPQTYSPYAYGAPPVTRRKSRWYIPVIIIVIILGLLAGAWFVFGDQIRGLFQSTAKKWVLANEASTLFPEDFLLAPLKESADQLVNQKQFGSITDLTFDVKADELAEDMAEFSALVSALRLRLESRVDLKEDNAAFFTRLGLGKRGQTSDALAVEIFNVDDHYVIALPDILDKPLVMSKDALAQLAGGGELPVELLNPGSWLDTSGVRDKLAFLTGNGLDGIVHDLKEIFDRYADEPELVKGETLTVGGVSQTLDYYERIVPKERFAPMAKDMLVYLRDNKNLKDLLEGGPDASGLPGLDGLEFGSYDQFIDWVDDALDHIDRNPDDMAIRAQRKLYVDKKNHPAGEILTLTRSDGGSRQEITLASLMVKDGNREAQQLRLEVPDQASFEWLTTFVREGDRSTGEFSLKASDGGTDPQEIVKGQFTGLAFEKVGDQALPVGTVTLSFSGLDQLMAQMEESLSLTYQGKVSSGRLIATVEVRLNVNETPVTITLGIEHQPLSGKEAAVSNGMPADYLDISDEDAMASLMGNEDVMNRLMQALEELGISPEMLNFTSGDDWDDWD